MRIESPKDLNKTTKKSSAQRARGGQRFIVGSSNASTGLSGASKAQSINHIGVLLAHQEVDEPQRQLQGAVRHGHDMLDQLDQLKLSILNGRLGPQTVNHLRHSLAQKRHFAVNDGLNSLLQQIELRAEVELAKLAKQRSKAI